MKINTRTILLLENWKHKGTAGAIAGATIGAVAGGNMDPSGYIQDQEQQKINLDNQVIDKYATEQVNKPANSEHINNLHRANQANGYQKSFFNMMGFGQQEPNTSGLDYKPGVAGTRGTYSAPNPSQDSIFNQSADPFEIKQDYINTGKYDKVYNSNWQNPNEIITNEKLPHDKNFQNGYIQSISNSNQSGDGSRSSFMGGFNIDGANTKNNFKQGMIDGINRTSNYPNNFKDNLINNARVEDQNLDNQYNKHQYNIQNPTLGNIKNGASIGAGAGLAAGLAASKNIKDKINAFRRT